MRSSNLSRGITIVLAIVMCMMLAVPTLGEMPADATAPLSGITIKTAEAAKYTLSPTFKQNTQVYTVTNKTAGAAMPATKTAAEAIIDFTCPDGTTAGTEFDAKAQLLTITTTKGSDSTVYYVSFSDKSEQQGTSNIADINVKKILQADENAKLDDLSFTYELISQGVVENTTPASYDDTKDNPAATAKDAVGTAATGTVTITNNGGDTSTMVMDCWDGENVPTLTPADAATINKTELAGHRVIDGTFSVPYDTVGQYVYLLHEINDGATGVDYDEEYYEVTVSVVHSDPADPTSAVVIGWIEVREATYNEDEQTYTPGAKVNFGTNTPVDGEKYDNYTTSITYPFVNILATEDLVINKTVTGDLGDREQEFLFKITLNGTNLAAAYTISYTNDDDGVKPTTITTDGSTGTVLLTLRHNVTATIAELPVGATYTVAELEADEDNTLASATEAANYNTTIVNDDTVYAQGEENIPMGKVAGDVKSQLSVAEKTVTHLIINTKPELDKNIVSVNNDKTITPPTGAFVDMIPYIAIVVVALAAIIVFIAVKKRRNVYED